VELVSEWVLGKLHLIGANQKQANVRMVGRNSWYAVTAKFSNKTAVPVTQEIIKALIPFEASVFI